MYKTQWRRGENLPLQCNLMITQHTHTHKSSVERKTNPHDYTNTYKEKKHAKKKAYNTLTRTQLHKHTHTSIFKREEKVCA